MQHLQSKKIYIYFFFALKSLLLTLFRLYFFLDEADLHEKIHIADINRGLTFTVTGAVIL